MTNSDIREMISDIVNNNAEYEVKKCNRQCNVVDDGLYCCCEYKKWIPYKLGDEIHSDCEYRKVEKWYVYESGDTYETRTYKTEPLPKGCEKYTHLFEGTKEECDEWIKENNNKTWLDERKSCLSVSFSKEVINGYSAGATEICKKILEKANGMNKQLDRYHKINIIELESIIKELGIYIEE